ncbi:hypothetical protein BOTBODRAFT_70948 [Botryobasidium botryosum FD-172 SS1]|uniref:Uncharacterized protein n=1 Tax=Botryobasidium botryosum (strain FD-172 SS1) TaxID=930990 RepID=A0A067M4D5_BOTB1|nr:hypothetical protein BOTBODRAFT_70948 [Botryobasidium botryosum FD-172 SS1]
MGQRLDYGPSAFTCTVQQDLRSEAAILLRGSRVLRPHCHDQSPQARAVLALLRERGAGLCRRGISVGSCGGQRLKWDNTLGKATWEHYHWEGYACHMRCRALAGTTAWTMLVGGYIDEQTGAIGALWAHSGASNQACRMDNINDGRRLHVSSCLT